MGVSQFSVPQSALFHVGGDVYLRSGICYLKRLLGQLAGRRHRRKERHIGGGYRMPALSKFGGRVCETLGLEEAVISIAQWIHCLEGIKRRVVVWIVLEGWGGIKGMGWRTRRHLTRCPVGVRVVSEKPSCPIQAGIQWRERRIGRPWRLSKHRRLRAWKGENKSVSSRRMALCAAVASRGAATSSIVRWLEKKNKILINVGKTVDAMLRKYGQ